MHRLPRMAFGVVVVVGVVVVGGGSVVLEWP